MTMMNTHLEGMLIECIDADRAWRTRGSFFGSNDGHGVRRVRSSDFVLSDNAQVIGRGGSKIENTSDILLGSRNEYSVDITFPRTLADLVFNNVTFYRAVTIVRGGPGKLNGATGFVQYFQTVGNFGDLCELIKYIKVELSFLEKIWFQKSCYQCI